MGVLKVALTGMLGGLIGSCLTWVLVTGNFRVEAVGMTYAEMAATVLGATAVLLAVLGLFMAVVAVLGLAQFCSMTRRAAQETAKDHIDDRLKNGALRDNLDKILPEYLEQQFKSGELRKFVEERVDHVLFAGAAARADMMHSTDQEEG